LEDLEPQFAENLLVMVLMFWLQTAVPNLPTPTTAKVSASFSVL
jgi:hypothetical protein